jgi:hypothetical protein
LRLEAAIATRLSVFGRGVGDRLRLVASTC